MTSLERRLCRWQEPAMLAKQLTNTWGEAGLIWLDGDGSGLGRWATLAVDPINQICCRGIPGEKGASNPFEALRDLEPGHWTGWLSYEAAAWIEPKNPWKADSMATLWMARHDPILRFDLQKRQLWIEGCHPKRLQELANWLEANPSENASENSKDESLLATTDLNIPVNTWQWLTTRADYARDVQQIRHWIASGDIFQANLSACCTTTIPSGSFAVDLFLKLRHHNPAPFAGLVIAAGLANGEAVISASPERFLKALPTGEVETRPIKGTRPRHPNQSQDADLAADLVCSSKDRAENVMIVDLLRNDLGRVCQPGSITVPQLVGLETYPHVHHLTSVVQGRLRSNQSWVDLLQACWPGGSISGAPKLRACQRLNELEPTARGPYCGSLLHLNWDGQLDSSILIRSMLLEGNTLRAHAGCGIVTGSDPYCEADELNWKLLPLLEALQ